MRTALRILSMVANLALPAPALAAMLTVSIVLGAASAGGVVFQVDTTADTQDTSAGDGTCADASGACSLRAAVEEANALAGADEVSIPAGVYALTGGFLSTDGDLTLRGAGPQATVLGTESSLNPVIFNDGDDLVVERLAITGGRTSGIVQFGGGIGASLTLSDSIVSDNGWGPSCSIGWCAGVLTFGSRVTVTRSTVARNNGGGLLGASVLTVTESAIMDNFGPAISSPETLVLKNSAITGNGPSSFGVILAATGRIESSTISGNVISNNWFCEAPGQLPCGCEPAYPVVSGDFEIQYSTIADNSFYTPSCAAMPDPVALGALRLRGTVLSNPGLANCGGPLESSGHNLDSDGTCSLAEATDLSGVDPLLGPLQDNGGPSPTHALLRGSPAIDAISPADCTFDDDGDPATPNVALAQDQRGAARPVWVGARCDIGAYEQTACADGLDNDADGRIDFDGGATAGLSAGELRPPDPQCATAMWHRERPACGLGFELAVVLPLLAGLRRRGKTAPRC